MNRQLWRARAVSKEESGDPFDAGGSPRHPGGRIGIAGSEIAEDRVERLLPTLRKQSHDILRMNHFIRPQRRQRVTHDVNSPIRPAGLRPELSTGVGNATTRGCRSG
jgi:hypothetical protein